MSRKYNKGEVERYFKDTGCILLEKEYINNRTKMRYRCGCGNISTICFSSFKSGSRCQKCKSKKLADERKHTLEFVKQFFKDNGCELLEKEYKNNSTKMGYICICGDISEISFANFRKGKRCRECGIKRGSEKQRYVIEFVSQFFKDNGCILLEKEYKNANSLLKYICSCGNESEIRFNNFLHGNRCIECGIEKNSGKNSSSYNPNLTNKDRINRRLIPGYNEWVKYTYKRDNYTCQKCKKRKSGEYKHIKIAAHHIEGYAENKDLRTDVDNGVCWCSECHFKFHRIYGKIDNNRKQYNDFIKIGV